MDEDKRIERLFEWIQDAFHDHDDSDDPLFGAFADVKVVEDRIFLCHEDGTWSIELTAKVTSGWNGAAAPTGSTQRSYVAPDGSSHETHRIDRKEDEAGNVFERWVTDWTLVGAAAPTTTCLGNDKTCPCQDGDLCHYVADKDTPAMAAPVEAATEDYNHPIFGDVTEQQ